MRLCGNVYALENFTSFSLKCFNCEYTTTKWALFQNHAKCCSNKEIDEIADFELYDEKTPSIELEELKLEGIETSVLIEKIKDEEHQDAFEDRIEDSLDMLDDENEYISTKDEEEFLDEQDDVVNSDIDYNVAYNCDMTVDSGGYDIGDNNEVNQHDDEDDVIKGDVEFLEEHILSESEWAAESVNDSDSCIDSDTSMGSQLKIEGAQTDIGNDKKFIVSFYRKDETTAFFIDLYKQQRSLWDTNDENFTNKQAHSKARRAMIESIYKKYKVLFKESKIKELINKIRLQYEETRRLYTTNPKSNQLKSLAIIHYKRCLFLGESELQNDTKGEANKLNMYTNRDKGLASKFKLFTVCTNEYINALIDIYKQYPELYDRNHEHYKHNRVRGKAQLQIIEELNSKHGGNCHGELLKQDELLTYISSLRHWCYGIREKYSMSSCSDQQPPLTDTERFFYEKCKFIPDYIKQTTFACEHCSSTFKSLSKYKCHQYNVHKIGEPYIFKCEHCHRGFPKQTSLSLHKQRHHTAKQFECEFCKRRFSIKADWQIHLRVHTNEKPYICEQCGRAFRLRNQLSNHVTTIHLRKRDFKCTMCPKAFYLKVHLKDHIKSHLDIRDKICNVCGKGFTNTHSLGRHRQIHSEVKKFACKLCDARFHQFVGLNSHMKRTHGIFKNKTKNE